MTVVLHCHLFISLETSNLLGNGEGLFFFLFRFQLHFLIRTNALFVFIQCTKVNAEQETVRQNKFNFSLSLCHFK